MIHIMGIIKGNNDSYDIIGGFEKPSKDSYVKD